MVAYLAKPDDSAVRICLHRLSMNGVWSVSVPDDVTLLCRSVNGPSEMLRQLADLCDDDVNEADARQLLLATLSRLRA